MYPDHRRQLQQHPDQQASRSEAKKNDSVCEFIHMVSLLIVSDGKRHAVDGANDWGTRRIMEVRRKKANTSDGQDRCRKSRGA
jgi:hypothetical protein